MQLTVSHKIDTVAERPHQSHAFDQEQAITPGSSLKENTSPAVQAGGISQGQDKGHPARITYI